jgi:hypothetical protein
MQTGFGPMQLPMYRALPDRMSVMKRWRHEDDYLYSFSAQVTNAARDTFTPHYVFIVWVSIEYSSSIICYFVVLHVVVVVVVVVIY